MLAFFKSLKRFKALSTASTALAYMLSKEVSLVLNLVSSAKAETLKHKITRRMADLIL